MPRDAERAASPRLDRRKLDALRERSTSTPAPGPQPESIYPEVERRVSKADRRSMDELRAEYQQTLMTDAERKEVESLRSTPFRIFGMRPSRVLLVIVALCAGGTAAFLALNRDAPAPAIAPEATTAPAIVAPARVQILVAKQAIGVGQRLSDATVGWQDWPDGSVLPQYVTQAATPDGMTGAVARFEIFPGEPIRQDKLIRADDGYLSAVLATGMRGVSVSVTAESASGGFIVPNDRVDVVLTRQSPTTNLQESTTVLRNVKVLAINTRLGETGATGAPTDPADPKAEIFDKATATLELDSAGSEVMINAANAGRLSLVLRSITDATQAASAGDGAANEAIRMTSPFWIK